MLFKRFWMYNFSRELYVNENILYKIKDYPINLSFTFREVISKRLAECVVLNQEYQKCFHKTKNKLKENPNERQFEFR